MSERISGVEGTKLDDDFHRCRSNKNCKLNDKYLPYSMEKKTDLFNELVDDLQIKTKEYLQVIIGHYVPTQPIWYQYLMLEGCDDA